MGAASQHRKEDSLIDLSAEDQSYMRPSQPEPDRLYMNVNKPAHSYQSENNLRVSDQPSNHVRVPSESSLLDEPIDIDQDEFDDDVEDADIDPNSDFYIDERTYANFPSSYADQTLTNESLDDDADINSLSTDIRAMSSTHVDDSVADVTHDHDNSFDSLPPGEKYHCPPFEEDPFDTSGIVIPESLAARRHQDERSIHLNGDVRPGQAPQDDLYARIKKSEMSQQQPSMLAQLLSSNEGSHIAAATTSTATTAATLNGSDNSIGNASFDLGSASHRRTIANFSDADAMLPQLTSPLSPPAFNPADVILGSNEAIAGLDSPALSMVLPKNSLARRNDDAFNWLENTMSDLKIGKKDAMLAQQSVTRNANVFQFPSVTSSISATQTSSVSAVQPKTNPPMNSLNSANSAQISNGRVVRNSVAVMPMSTMSMSMTSMPTSRSSTFTKPPSYAPPPVIIPSQVRPQVDHPQPSTQHPSQNFLSWPVRAPTVSSAYQPMTNFAAAPASMSPRPSVTNATAANGLVQSNPAILTPIPAASHSPRPQASTAMPASMPFMASVSQALHPNLSVPTNLNTLSASPASHYQVIRPQQMYQSPPAPTILQPQKISQPANQQQDQSRQSKMFDKEFILELEKNLGLREATANLMPPSPAPSTDHTPRPMMTLEPNIPGSIPALRPPPQSTLRHNSRRNTTSVTPSALAEASLMYQQQQQQHQQQQQQRRESSLPRPSQNNNSSSTSSLQVGFKLHFFK